MAKTRKAAAQRRDLYDDITNKIISELEEGRLPWVQPWGAADVSAPLALPCNAGTGRRYSGINILILWGAVVQKGYPGQGWLTCGTHAPVTGHHSPRSSVPNLGQKLS